MQHQQERQCQKIGIEARNETDKPTSNWFISVFLSEVNHNLTTFFWPINHHIYQ
jgi:hypothetical protein